MKLLQCIYICLCFCIGEALNAKANVFKIFKHKISATLCFINIITLDIFTDS